MVFNGLKVSRKAKNVAIVDIMRVKQRSRASKGAIIGKPRSEESFTTHSEGCPRFFIVVYLGESDVFETMLDYFHCI